MQILDMQTFQTLSNKAWIKFKNSVIHTIASKLKNTRIFRSIRTQMCWNVFYMINNYWSRIHTDASRIHLYTKYFGNVIQNAHRKHTRTHMQRIECTRTWKRRNRKKNQQNEIKTTQLEDNSLCFVHLCSSFRRYTISILG